MSRPDELKLRSDGYWYSQWYDADGSRRTKTFGHHQTTPRRIAEREWKCWVREWERSDAVRNPDKRIRHTIGFLVDEYLEHARGYYRRPDGTQTGEASNMADALKVLQEHYPDTDPQEFSPRDLQACQHLLVAQKLSRTTINDRIKRVLRFFRWCTTRGEIRGVVQDLECVPPLAPGRTTAKEPKALVPVHRSEVEAVFAKLPPVVRDMVDLAWYTGMRPGELVIMRACDLDMTGERWVYTPAQHKTLHRGKDRKIFLGPKAQEIVKRYLVGAGVAGYLFSPKEAMIQRCEAEGRKVDGYLNAEFLGERYTPKSFRMAIVRACDHVSAEAEVAEKDWPKHRWTPYQLRRACATRLEKDYGVEAARVVLGHSEASTTERYITRDGENAAKIMGEAG